MKPVKTSYLIYTRYGASTNYGWLEQFLAENEAQIVGIRRETANKTAILEAAAKECHQNGWTLLLPSLVPHNAEIAAVLEAAFLGKVAGGPIDIRIGTHERLRDALLDADKRKVKHWNSIRGEHGKDVFRKGAAKSAKSRQRKRREHYAEVKQIIADGRKAGKTWEEIADELNRGGFKTIREADFTAANTHRLGSSL